VRAKPNHVDAEILEVIEPAGDAVQVTDAVAVRVLERARVNLVDDCFFPPVLRVAVNHSDALGCASSIGGCGL